MNSKEVSAKLRNKVYYMVQGAKSRKQLISQNCEICDMPHELSVAHHEDYLKPFQVHWLCKSCHIKLHKGVPEQIITWEDKVKYLKGEMDRTQFLNLELTLEV